MPVVGNWTAELSITTGTGPVVVSGAVDANHARFRDVAPAGEVYYSIVDGDDREAGIGVFNGVDTITRVQVTATLRSLVYNKINPTPLNLSGSSVVSLTLNSGAFDAKADISYVDNADAQISLYAESLHRITTRIVTGSTNLLLTDERNSVSINNAGAVTLTIDPITTTSYQIGFQFIIVQAGAGVVTVTPGAGVTVLGLPSTNGLDDIITVYHESADVWRVAGGVA